MVDWEGLKSKREAAKHSAGGQWDFNHTMFDEFPAILAQHEADQRVIEAAEKIINAVRGLAFGTDWNKGTHAEIYRPKLLAELAEFDKAKQ